MDNNQATPQKPTYIKSDGDSNVLSNLDISTQQTPTTSKPQDQAEIQSEVYSQFGYTSPYASSTPQTQPTYPTQSTQSSPQPYQPTPVYPPSQVESPVFPAPIQKNQIVYERTVVEKGPGFFSVLFGQIFRFIGCFLFIISAAIIVIVYLVNF